MALIILLFGLFIVGVPICFSLGLISLYGVAAAGYPLSVITQRMFTGADSISLIAIPLFILAGGLMVQGGMSRRIVDFADAPDWTFPQRTCHGQYSGLHVLCRHHRFGHCGDSCHRRYHDSSYEGKGV